MNFKVKYFHELTTTELYKILKARSEVFVIEQKCLYQDMDDIDYSSLHIFFESEKKIKAYLRAFQSPEWAGAVQIGRVLTTKRGKGLGHQLLKKSIPIISEKMNVKRFYLHAQCYAIGFYEREGFQVCSGEFLEDGIPHVQMKLEIPKKNG